MPKTLLLANVRPMGGEAADVLIEDGRIAAIGRGLSAPDRLDGAGAILLPGLVEAHTHMDKTLLGRSWQPHRGGPRLTDFIANDRRMKRELDLDPATQSSRQVALTVGHGTSHIRTHVDVDTEVGVRGIEGVLETRQRYRDAVDIQIVAFPQSGVLIRPGTLELLDQAMRLGADLVGGLDPSAIDRDPKGHLDAIFGLADRHGKGIDIHLHEPGELGAFAVELIVERTAALGMRGKVAISHAFCLAMPEEARVGPLIEGLVEQDVAVMTTGPASRPAPPIRRLTAAGIRVGSGNDGIRDAWSPYGNGDMLERAMLLGLANNCRSDADLELALSICTRGGAAMLGLDRYGLEPGCDADLALVDAETLAEAVVSHRPRRLVLERGRVVAEAGRSLVEAP
jgi:cytosine/adenosine deaminase-related metal-dependent hydrolase